MPPSLFNAILPQLLSPPSLLFFLHLLPSFPQLVRGCILLARSPVMCDPDSAFFPDKAINNGIPDNVLGCCSTLSGAWIQHQGNILSKPDYLRYSMPPITIGSECLVAFEDAYFPVNPVALSFFIKGWGLNHQEQKESSGHRAWSGFFGRIALIFGYLSWDELQRRLG